MPRDRLQCSSRHRLLHRYKCSSHHMVLCTSPLLDILNLVCLPDHQSWVNGHLWDLPSHKIPTSCQAHQRGQLDFQESTTLDRWDPSSPRKRLSKLNSKSQAPIEPHFTRKASTSTEVPDPLQWREVCLLVPDTPAASSAETPGTLQQTNLVVARRSCTPDLPHNWYSEGHDYREFTHYYASF